REVVEVERLEHIDHEVAAARRLCDRIFYRRLRLDRNLPRPRHGGLRFVGGRWQGVRRDRRTQRRRTGKRRTFAEVAASDRRRIVRALRCVALHEFLLSIVPPPESIGACRSCTYQISRRLES